MCPPYVSTEKAKEYLSDMNGELVLSDELITVVDSLVRYNPSNKDPLPGFRGMIAQVVLHLRKNQDRIEILRFVLGEHEDYPIELDVMDISEIYLHKLVEYLHPSTIYFVPKNSDPLRGADFLGNYLFFYILLLILDFRF